MTSRYERRYLFDAPSVIRNSLFHRWRHAQRLMLSFSWRLTSSTTSLALQIVKVYRRDPSAVTTQEGAEEYVAVTSQHELSGGLAEATVFRSRALVGLGRAEEGLADARHAIEEADKSGLLRLYFFNYLAECLLTSGNIAEGLATVERAERLDLRRDADLRRVKGELLRRRQPADEVEAEACFRLAIERARRLSAKSIELLAAMGLARLLRDTNRRDEARAMLADIYNWFTEASTPPT